MKSDIKGITGKLADLGIKPTPLDTVAPGWLVQYRRHGRFTNTAAAA